MRRGVQFEVPNRYGTLLGDLLSPVDTAGFDWFVGGEEAYRIESDETDAGDMSPLWPDELENGMEGRALKQLVDSTTAYVIFANLKAYPKGSDIADVATYEHYLASDCRLALLVVDCAYVAIYAKDVDLLDRLYANAEEHGYENLQWITDDNDSRTKLSVW